VPHSKACPMQFLTAVGNFREVTRPAAHIVKQEIGHGAEVTVTRSNKLAVDADALSHRQNRKPIE